MYIKKRRIRNPERYLSLFKAKEEIFISIPLKSVDPDRLTEIGFDQKPKLGDQILPAGIGSISNFNADGKYKKLTHLPMETAYRQGVWRWKDWGGNEHSKIVDIPYKRYQREFIEPPSEELSVTKNTEGKIIISRKFKNTKTAYGEILHCINLFLEIFGECEILSKNLKAPQKIKPIRLNWEILPPGKYPWKIVKSSVGDSLDRQPNGNKPIIKNRIETISNYNPDFCATGKGGFNGYMVFGFKSKNLYILESVYNNNATYVFKDNWETFSKMTKKEVINGGHQLKRIIHREGWSSNIKTLFAA